MDNVFVIGDVHGHLDRLEALLKQEGLLGRCIECDGGEVEGEPSHDERGAIVVPLTDCRVCLGEGTRRMRDDVMVVQLGDLGHFGTRGSPTGDILCYKYVTVNRWADVVLWGNHDRAAIDGTHHASDFMQVHEALHYIRILWEQGRMQIALEAHGFLITHAGIAAAFEHQTLPDGIKRNDPVVIADWLNDQDELFIESGMAQAVDPNALAIVNAIGRSRDGRAPTGGLLWRDINEGLYVGFRQIFGHSADPKHAVRYCGKGINTRYPEKYSGADDWSYCIDVAGKGDRPGDACLAGIWLPSERIARVDL